MYIIFVPTARYLSAANMMRDYTCCIVLHYYKTIILTKL